MKVKTYGISDLSEWHGELRAGSLTAKVSFTGGTAISNVSHPAYYVSMDPVVQFVIEHSKEYHSGFIKLVMVQNVPGEHPRTAVPKQRVDNGANGINGSDGRGEPEEGVTVQHVTVADKADAVEWLKEHYPDKGYTATKLRTQEAFNAACEECEVVFDFK